MRRSEINALLREAVELFEAAGMALPPWARFTPADWAARPQAAAFCRARQMGWDVTDFGGGDFARKGLVLLCTRNGIVGQQDERSYGEKLLLIREGQEAPYHFHHFKMEDIIVRGGGQLVLQVFDTDTAGQPIEAPTKLRLDAEERVVPARTPITLARGASVTLPPGQAHRLTAAPGGGTVVLGEISRVNDDLTDNVFFEPVARFPAVEEDAPVLYPLWSELPS